MPQIPVREWGYVHTELQWIYDREVYDEYHSQVIENRDAYAAWFVRAGRAVIETEAGERLAARPGQWLLVPRTKYFQRFSKDARILSVHFICEWPSGDTILSGSGGLVLSGKDCLEMEARAAALEKLVRSHTPHADARYHSYFCAYPHFLEAHSLFLQWLGYWFTAQLAHGSQASRVSVRNDRLLQAMRCLNTAPLHRALPYKDLQRLTGLSVAHLNRLVLANQGTSLRKIWDNRRLKQARSLLETSRVPIKEVAYGLGFLSDSHFSKWFKLHAGKKPKAYRDASREAGGEEGAADQGK